MSKKNKQPQPQPASKKRGKGKKSVSITLHGSGDYTSGLKKALQRVNNDATVRTLSREAKSAIGRTVGAAGDMFGMGPLAQQLAHMGMRAGSKGFGRLIGSGDYQPAVNSLMKGSISSDMSFGEARSTVRLRHREFVSLITAPSPNTFAPTSYSLNPTSETFPFLSQIARNYEMYAYHGIVFEYISLVSNYAGSGVLGSNILAMQYNPYSAPYNTASVMRNSDFAVDARIDNDLVYGVECNPALRAKPLLFTNQVGNTPLTDVSMGTLYLASVEPGLASGQTMGELWVTYDVELVVPRLAWDSNDGYARISRLSIGGSGTTLPSMGTGNNTTAGAVVYNGFFNANNITVDTNTITLTNVSLGDLFMVVLHWNMGSTSFGINMSGTDSYLGFQVYGQVGGYELGPGGGSHAPDSAAGLTNANSDDMKDGFIVRTLQATATTASWTFAPSANCQFPNSGNRVTLYVTAIGNVSTTNV